MLHQPLVVSNNLNCCQQSTWILLELNSFEAICESKYEVDKSTEAWKICPEDTHRSRILAL